MISVAKVVNDMNTQITNAADGKSGVVLLGHIYNVDIPARQIEISWLMIGCGALRLEGTSSYGVANCGRLAKSVSFFVDGSSEPNATYDPSNLVYVADRSRELYVQAVHEFQTTHLLEISAWNGLDAQYSYPFDTYFLEMNFVGYNTETNNTVTILALMPVDSTNNFVPLLADAQASVVNASGTPVRSRYLRIEFQRTTFTRFFVVAMLVVNWGLTFVVMHITVCAVNGRNVEESILVTPISVILTIPALRALWVGAPPFGLLLDTFGLFMQMIVVSICSIFLIGVVALRGAEPRPADARMGAHISRDDEAKRDRDDAQDAVETEPILLSAQEPELGRTSHSNHFR